MPIHPSATVAPTARVHPDACIGAQVVVGDFCVIEQDVTIGQGCRLEPYVYVKRWTTMGERKLYLFDARKIIAPTFGAVRGRKIGEVVSVGEAGMRILAQGGFVEASRVRLDDGAKIAATDAGIAEGTVLGG